MGASPFKVGHRKMTMPGEKLDERMPGTELTDDDVKLLQPNLRRLLETGVIVSDTVRARDLDMDVGGGATLVDERIARNRLAEGGFDIPEDADRAMVYAAYDVAIGHRDAKTVAKDRKVDLEALKKLTTRSAA